MKKLVVILLIMTAMLVGSMIGTAVTLRAFKTHYVDLDFAENNNEKLNAIWDIVDKNYVDPMGGDSVMDKVYGAVLSTLDPHSLYLPRKVLEKETESLQGRFEGVGVLIRKINDTVCVAQVIEGGPSDHAGLQAGDRILTVDGVTVSGVDMPNDSVVVRLRGPRKSTTDLQILRLSEGKPRAVRVVRDVIHTHSLAYSGMLDKETGYVRLDMFGENTYDEFYDAVKELKRQGMKRLVIDLRDNGGGLLSAALEICDELLGGREMIVYTEGRHQKRNIHRSTPGGLFSEGEVIVMIDEFSASASEIVAGAVQDNDRGLVVGRRSFGKGLVQQQFQLPDGSALQLTVARYYTPSGRCIQRPYDKGTDEYYSEFVKNVTDNYLNDSLLWHPTDTTPYYTAKGRVVYGGGGIMPDHVIRYKSDENVVYYNKLVNQGVINDYVFDYVSINGAKIKKTYGSQDDFVKRYRVDDCMMRQLFNRADKKGIARDEKSISRYREEIRARVKANIGDMLYSSKAFYAVELPYDPELKEALSAAREPKK